MHLTMTPPAGSRGEKVPQLEVSKDAEAFNTMEKRRLLVESMSNAGARGRAQENDGGHSPGAQRQQGASSIAMAWGADQKMQLGREESTRHDRDSHLPRPVAFAEGTTVCSIACGDSHCAGLDAAGHVYCWGSNTHGQLGFETEELLVRIPTLVVSIADISVAQISCGKGHTVALDCNGKLWTWGQGNEGQLGHGGTKRMRKPTMVPSTTLFKCASAGDLHTAAVSDKSQLFTFGSGMHGQLGNNSDADELRPREVVSMFSHRVGRVRCGPFTTGAILEDGRVALCGFGEYMYCTGQDRGGAEVSKTFTPKQLSGVSTQRRHTHSMSRLPVFLNLPCLVQDLAFGRNHAVALSRDGAVYCWGSGIHGQCGHGQLSPVFRPRLIIEDSVISISAGRYHSASVDSHGFLLTWGAAEQGQLGHGLSTKPQPFPRIVKQIFGRVISTVSCGPHHTAVTASPDFLGNGNDMLEVKTAFDIAAKLKMLLVERQGGQGTGLTQHHLDAVQSAQAGDIHKLTVLLCEGMPAGSPNSVSPNRQPRSSQARLRAMLDRVGLHINSNGHIIISAAVGSSAGISPDQMAKVLENEHEALVTGRSSSTPSQTPRGQSMKVQQHSSPPTHSSPKNSFEYMRKAFFVAESKRRSVVQAERGHRPMSAKVRPALSTRVASRPTSARESTRNSSWTPRSPKSVRKNTGSPRTPRVWQKEPVVSTPAFKDKTWSTDDEDAITQAGMVASRIAVYSEQRVLMNRSKQAMAVAIKSIGRNTASMQDTVTKLRTELDKYSMVRHEKQMKLKELELEFSQEKEFTEVNEAKLRKQREHMQDLESAKYVADIAIVETRGE